MRALWLSPAIGSWQKQPRRLKPYGHPGREIMLYTRTRTATPSRTGQDNPPGQFTDEHVRQRECRVIICYSLPVTGASPLFLLFLGGKRGGVRQLCFYCKPCRQVGHFSGYFYYSRLICQLVVLPISQAGPMDGRLTLWACKGGLGRGFTGQNST